MLTRRNCALVVGVWYGYLDQKCCQTGEVQSIRLWKPLSLIPSSLCSDSVLTNQPAGEFWCPQWMNHWHLGPSGS